MCRCLFLPSLLFRGGEKGEGVIAFCIQAAKWECVWGMVSFYGVW